MSKEKDKNKKESALKVNEGIDEPSQINPDVVKKFLSQKKTFSVEEIIEGIKKGDRVALSRAITLIESLNPTHYELAQKIIQECLPLSGKSLRIGITGIPGAGKSTFIESFGTMLTNLGHNVAVLAIDPTSQISKGSILGDKVRMEKLATNPKAFIRPSPSAGTLGGVSRKTKESMILCEAAGFDIILIETVGVGQSEVAVKNMIDFFLLLLVAGAGDELQGMKRGIIEMADAIFINKADGDNLNKAKISAQEYKLAMHLLPPHPAGWIPVVDVCSAITGYNLDIIWETIQNYVNLTKNNGYFDRNRQQQEAQRIYDYLVEELNLFFWNNDKLQSEYESLKQQVLQQKLTAYQAAAILKSLFIKLLSKL